MGLITKLAWVALPALAGCGVLSQVSSQGTGTNPGGKASAMGLLLLAVGSGTALSGASYPQQEPQQGGGNTLALSANSNSRSNKAVARLDVVPSDYVSSNTADTIFKGRLYWPENRTAFGVNPVFDWDNYMKDPSNTKYGGRLPHYGDVPIIEVNDDINAVWNMTKTVKHIPGEKIASLSKRIQEPVDKFIADKNKDRAEQGLPPLTSAHRTVLKAAANESFVTMNMTVGHHGLTSGPAVEPQQGSQMSGGDPKLCEGSVKVAQQILDLEVPKGSCGYHTSVLLALNHYAGIKSLQMTVQDRPLDYRGGYVLDESRISNGTANGVANHSIIATYLESVDQKRFRESNGKLGMDSPSVAISNPTYYTVAPQDRAPLLASNVHPFPEHMLAGAKGDTIYGIQRSGSMMFQKVDDVYNANNTRGWTNWDNGDFYKADVSSIRTIIDDTNALRSQWIKGL